MVVVLEIFVVVLQLLVLFSHLTMLPLCPLKVMVPELDPEQTVALELVDPPTVLHTVMLVVAVLFPQLFVAVRVTV